MINSAICNFLDNKDVDINIRECFDEIFSGLSEPILSGIFLALLEFRQYDIEDIVAGIESAKNAVKKINSDIDGDSIIENICLNPKADLFDISFAVDIICSANDIASVKTIPSNYCYKNNSFDTLRAFNIDAENFKTDNFEKIKFNYSYIQADNPYIKYTKELYRLMPFKNILNIINNFLNPYGAKNCTIALCNKDMVEKYANICLLLKYNNSVVYSSGDFPYVSTENETRVAEAWKNKIFSYTITPELLGIKRNPVSLLKIENSEHGAQILNAVFENKIKDIFYDAITINSALALYITKRAKSLMEGFDLAKSTIDSGQALDKLIQIKNTF